MGEYFCWINFDRKEYIWPWEFIFGNRRFETIKRDNIFLSVLQDLLANEWKGCRIAWIGDGCTIPEDTAEDLFKVLKMYLEDSDKSGSVTEKIYYSFRNVSGLYKESEVQVRENIEYCLRSVEERKREAISIYGINPDAPFDGFFQREGRHYRYVINYTKKICYDIEQTKILTKDGITLDTIDPLPVLLGCGRYLTEGEWFGDVIGADDDVDDSIRVLDCIELDWKKKSVSLKKAYSIAKKYLRIHWTDNTQLHLCGVKESEHYWILAFVPFIPKEERDDTCLVPNALIHNIKGCIPVYYGGGVSPVQIDKETGICESLRFHYYDYHSGKVEMFFRDYHDVDVMTAFAERKSKGNNYKCEEVS